MKILVELSGCCSSVSAWERGASPCDGLPPNEPFRKAVTSSGPQSAVARMRSWSIFPASVPAATALSLWSGLRPASTGA